MFFREIAYREQGTERGGNLANVLIVWVSDAVQREEMERFLRLVSYVRGSGWICLSICL